MARTSTLALASAMFASLLLTADTTAQSVRAYVEVDSISVGERIRLTVAVDQAAPSRAAITFPTPPPDTLGSFLRFGDLLIVDILGVGSTGDGEDLVSDSIIYEATTFALDTARAAPMPVLLTSGTDTLVLATDALFIPVRSVVPADAEDIIDLMPIADFRQPIWPWLLFLAVLLATMAAFIFWYRRSPPQTLIERASAQPSLPPDEEAYARLEQLESRALETESDKELFCVELSDTLRTYLWRRTAVHALEMTTNELVERVDGMEAADEMSDGVSQLIAEVLQVCDLAKFAEVFPAATVCVEEANRTRDVIDRVEAYYTPIPQEIDAADSASTGTQADASDIAGDTPDNATDTVDHSDEARDDATVSDTARDKDYLESSLEDKSSRE